MREIEYKGKRKDTNEWVYGYFWKAFGEHFFIKSLTKDKKSYADFEIKPETLGQFTGLYDKKHNKIYEGDIVVLNDDAYELFTIKWDEKTAAFIFESEDLSYSFDNYSGHDLEVIGNIHDNPNII